MSELYLTAGELVEMRANLVTKPAVTRAWNNHILPSANAELNRTPSPAPGGVTFMGDTWRTAVYGNGTADGRAARHLALAYALTEGNASFATATRNAWGDKSRDIVMAWVNTNNPPGLAAHYVAYPVGPCLKMFMAYTLTEDRYSAAQKTAFLNWCGYFVTMGKNQCIQAGNKASTDTSGGPWVNGAAWARSMAVLAGALRRDDSIWTWNWDGPAVNKPYGWEAYLQGIITNADGRIYDEAGRQSLGYAFFTLHPASLIADWHAHYAPPGVDRMRLWGNTPSPVRSLLLAANHYAPYLSGTPDPYASGPDPLDQDEYRAFYESLAKVFPASTPINTAVTFGGNNQRGDNDDGHITSWNAIIGQVTYLGATPPVGSAGAVTVENDQLKFVTPDILTGYVGLNSLADYDLTDSRFGARLVNAGTQSANRECFIEVASGASKLTLAVKNNVLEARKNGTVMQQTGYIATDHRHLQFESSGGTSRWRYSADGITYSNLHTEANPFTLTALELRLRAGNINSTTTTTVLWDDVNAITGAPTATRGPINLLMGMAG